MPDTTQCPDCYLNVLDDEMVGDYFQFQELARNENSKSEVMSHTKDTFHHLAI